MTQLADILNSVEDDLSDVPFEPEQPTDAGRMYPPQEDARREVEGRPDLKRYRTKAHNVYVSNEGALRIEEVKGKRCVFSKPSKSGKTINL